MLSLLKQTWKEFSEDDCATQAAALAYYTIFALPPLLILLILLAGTVWNPQDVERAMQTQFAGLVGREGARAIQEMLRSANRLGAGGFVATVLGVAGLLFGATGAFMQLQTALNRACEVKPDPSKGGIKAFIGKRVLSVGMILAIAFLMIVSLAMSALLSALGKSLAFFPEPIFQVVDFVLSFAVLAVLFGAMFNVLPDAKVEWRDVRMGALVTAALFVVGKFAIGLYLGRSRPGSAFGAASALAVVLVWIYYAGMIVLFGAEFTQAWVRRGGREIEPEEGAVAIEPRDGSKEAGPPEKRAREVRGGVPRRSREEGKTEPERVAAKGERPARGGGRRTLSRSGLGALAATVGLVSLETFRRVRAKRAKR